MAVPSGKDGYVVINACTVLQLSKWTLEYGPEIHKFASRAGGGADQTVAGVFSGSGTIEVMYDDDTPITSTLTPGELYTATLYQNATDSHTGSMRLGKFSFEVDREGTEERVSIPFETHGLWTLQSS